MGGDKTLTFKRPMQLQLMKVLGVLPQFGSISTVLFCKLALIGVGDPVQIDVQTLQKVVHKTTKSLAAKNALPRLTEAVATLARILSSLCHCKREHHMNITNCHELPAEWGCSGQRTRQPQHRANS